MSRSYQDRVAGETAIIMDISSPRSNGAPAAPASFPPPFTGHQDNGPRASHARDVPSTITVRATSPSMPPSCQDSTSTDARVRTTLL